MIVIIARIILLNQGTHERTNFDHVGTTSSSVESYGSTRQVPVQRRKNKNPGGGSCNPKKRKNQSQI